MNLDANQKRHVLNTFVYIDGLLEDIERVFSPERSFRIFDPCIWDVDPRNQTEYKMKIAEFRSKLSEILDQLGVPLPVPHVGSRQAAVTMLDFIDIALEELTAKYMLGYGDLEKESADELDGMVLNLKDALNRLGGII